MAVPTCLSVSIYFSFYHCRTPFLNHERPSQSIDIKLPLILEELAKTWFKKKDYGFFWQQLSIEYL